MDALTRRPVPEAEVTLEPSAGQALTNARGEFVIPELEPGLYTVRATSVGYAPAVQAEIRVQSSRSTFVLLEMEAQALQIEGLVVERGAFAVPSEAPVSAALLSPAEVRRT
ncbi:MAG: carboxypeptidase-like regulatory domain-containing protein, partial [Gemmatimonadota bacterium]